MNQIILRGATAIALEAIRRAYKADRSNSYRVAEDCPFLLALNLPAYDGLFWRFEPDGQGYTLATLKAYGEKVNGATVCDGASFAPDGLPGVREAAAMHDPGYLELQSIADAWAHEPYAPGGNLKRSWWMKKSERWTEEDVRNLFDAIFGDALRKLGGSSFIARCYYSAVRCFGGLYRRFARGAAKSAAVAVAAMALMSGCGGCYSPPDIIDGPFDGPEVIQVHGGEGVAEIAADVVKAAKELKGAQ